jgi:AraC-like DNA-binding protein
MVALLNSQLFLLIKVNAEHVLRVLSFILLSLRFLVGILSLCQRGGNNQMAINIGLVKTFVNEHIGTVHSIEEIARSLHVSAETLRKQFRREERIPLSKFVTMTRVKRAKKLLCRTDLKCFEVCYSVGFRREDSGATTFKRMVGMTMEAYRLQNIQSKTSNPTTRVVDHQQADVT